MLRVSFEFPCHGPKPSSALSAIAPPISTGVELKTGDLWQDLGWMGARAQDATKHRSISLSLSVCLCPSLSVSVYTMYYVLCCVVFEIVCTVYYFTLYIYIYINVYIYIYKCIHISISICICICICICIASLWSLAY